MSHALFFFNTTVTIFALKSPGLNNSSYFVNQAVCRCNLNTNPLPLCAAFGLVRGPVLGLALPATVPHHLASALEQATRFSTPSADLVKSMELAVREDEVQRVRALGEGRCNQDKPVEFLVEKEENVLCS